MKEDWKKYVVTVGDIEFRPVSMASLSILYSINSPLVMGGEVEPLDFCIFAWLHATPIMEVYASIKSGSYIRKALIWGSEVPPIIFTSYTSEAIAKLGDDLNKLFIEENSGFIPFPYPSPLIQSWWKRAIHTMKHLLKFG